MSDELFKEMRFDYVEDHGADIIYSLRYSKDRLIGHRKQVIGALKSLDIELIEIDDQICVDYYRPVDESFENRVKFLFEELSHINVALDMKKQLNGNLSMENLCYGIQNAYNAAISLENMFEANMILHQTIPSFYDGVKDASLRKNERNAIKELRSFAYKKSEELENYKPAKIIGNSFN